MTMWVALVATVAHATTYNVTFCAEVDIALLGGSSGAGDYWTNDGDDKEARGFEFELSKKVGALYTVMQTGNLSDSTGCSGSFLLDSTEQYKLTIFSEALVDGNTLYAYDNDTNNARASAAPLFGWSPTSSTTVTVTLNGSTDDRWNHLVMAAFALYFESAGLTGETMTLFSDQGPTHTAHTDVYLDSTTNNFTIIHELGHAVSSLVNDGGAGYALNWGSPMDNCDGGGGTYHGTVTKEFYSCAMVEGIASWYSALTWNNISTTATDCEYVRNHDIDFNLDSMVDVTSPASYPCTGDPHADAWVSADDWLEDAIVEGEGGCTTPKANRSTQFDFVRYLFAMRTEEDLTMNQIWNLWDDSDPHSWDGNGGSLCLDPLLDPCDDPEDRWEAAADNNSVGTAHDSQKDHGLDHY